MLFSQCSKDKKHPPSIPISRIKTLLRKFVEEIIEEEQEAKEKDFGNIAESLKNDLQKLSISVGKKERGEILRREKERNLLNLVD